ncbi:hypothetical protein ACRQ5Q_10205 [Bradyrhizobium sp. PMVTL-01]|uniref:hypothetical protein n=1 Tax=Bradyrhizobium sp. PMVTL-01 TaxID=3434999 RepID=UPI003F70B219
MSSIESSALGLLKKKEGFFSGGDRSSRAICAALFRTLIAGRGVGHRSGLPRRWLPSMGIEAFGFHVNAKAMVQTIENEKVAACKVFQKSQEQYSMIICS